MNNHRPASASVSAKDILGNLIRRRDSGSRAGGVAVRREPASVKDPRTAATCCFWQRRDKEAAQTHKTKGGFEVAHRNRGNRFSLPNTGTSEVLLSTGS